MYFATVILPRLPTDHLASIEAEEEIADSAHIFAGFLHGKKGRVFVYEFRNRQDAESFQSDQSSGILPANLTIRLSKEAPE